MKHPFQCRCGALRGELAHAERGVRAACYCRDCQAYAHLLGQAAHVLDAQGGTDVVATTARHVRFTTDTGSLACLSLSPRGLLRWYARCCGTPLANTPRDWKLPYVGLVHTCLRQPQPFEHAFPRVRVRANTGSALAPPPRDNSVAGMLALARLMLRLAGSRIGGRYRGTPFFDGGGTPVVPVSVAERAAVEAARSHWRPSG